MINDDKNNEIEDELKNLIGRKVRIKVNFRARGEGANRLTYKEYLIKDTKFLEEINNMAPLVRIYTPGTIGSTEYKDYRLNVFINKDGVVFKAFYG